MDYLAPSVLSADFSTLGNEIAIVAESIFARVSSTFLHAS
mgnify:CR=1 FL=1